MMSEKDEGLLGTDINWQAAHVHSQEENVPANEAPTSDFDDLLRDVKISKRYLVLDKSGQAEVDRLLRQLVVEKDDSLPYSLNTEAEAVVADALGVSSTEFGTSYHEDLKTTYFATNYFDIFFCRTANIHSGQTVESYMIARVGRGELPWKRK